jgi:hypothetical protein
LLSLGWKYYLVKMTWSEIQLEWIGYVFFAFVIIDISSE